MPVPEIVRFARVASKLQKRFQLGQLGRREIRKEVDEILLLFVGKLHGFADAEFDRIPYENGLADGGGKHGSFDLRYARTIGIPGRFT